MRHPFFGLALAFCVAACGQPEAAPGLKGRVIDEANILTDSQEEAIGKVSQALEQQTGDQLGIVTVPSLNGQTIEEVARARGNAWGLGSKELDNGVLILLAPNQRKVRVQVGYGLERLLTDDRAMQVVRAMTARFEKGDYSGGIQQGAQEIDQILRSDTRRPQYAAMKEAA